MHRWMRRLAVTAAAIAIAAAGFTVPAQASSTEVDGSGALHDDFGEHYEELDGYLCNGCRDNTDLVVMWQAILYSEGYLEKGEIDGYFGPGTEAATRRWQDTANNLSVDGVVGDATWNRVDNRLYWGKDSRGYWCVKYNAAEGSGTVVFSRGNGLDYGDDGEYRLDEAFQGGGHVIFEAAPWNHSIELFDREYYVA